MANRHSMDTCPMDRTMRLAHISTQTHVMVDFSHQVSLIRLLVAPHLLFSAILPFLTIPLPLRQRALASLQIPSHILNGMTDVLRNPLRLPFRALLAAELAWQVDESGGTLAVSICVFQEGELARTNAGGSGIAHGWRYVSAGDAVTKDVKGLLDVSQWDFVFLGKLGECDDDNHQRIRSAI